MPWSTPNRSPSGPLSGLRQDRFPPRAVPHSMVRAGTTPPPSCYGVTLSTTVVVGPRVVPGFSPGQSCPDCGGGGPSPPDRPRSGATVVAPLAHGSPARRRSQVIPSTDRMPPAIVRAMDRSGLLTVIATAIPSVVVQVNPNPSPNEASDTPSPGVSCHVAVNSPATYPRARPSPAGPATISVTAATAATPPITVPR